MISKLKSLRNHQGFMKYFKNTSKPDETMIKLTDLYKLFGWKHMPELKKGIRKMNECYLEKCNK